MKGNTDCNLILFNHRIPMFCLTIEYPGLSEIPLNGVEIKISKWGASWVKGWVS